jgi:hypothetical protein
LAGGHSPFTKVTKKFIVLWEDFMSTILHCHYISEWNAIKINPKELNKDQNAKKDFFFKLINEILGKI